MKMRVPGFVYLHSISQVRMGSSALLSYELARSICGPIGLKRTVMASTQWEVVLYNLSAGPIRERMLQEAWSEALAQGAVYKCINAMNPQLATEGVVDYILRKYAVAAQTQNELFRWDKREAERLVKERFRERLGIRLGDSDPQTQDLSKEKEEAGFVNWLRGFFVYKTASPQSAL
jgi:hypothetical protein